MEFLTLKASTRPQQLHLNSLLCRIQKELTCVASGNGHHAQW